MNANELLTKHSKEILDKFLAWRINNFLPAENFFTPTFFEQFAKEVGYPTKVGQLVRFASLVDPGDEKARMIILEYNGDRCLVEHQVNMAIKPTDIYPTIDLKLI